MCGGGVFSFLFFSFLSSFFCSVPYGVIAPIHLYTYIYIVTIYGSSLVLLHEMYMCMYAHERAVFVIFVSIHVHGYMYVRVLLQCIHAHGPVITMSLCICICSYHIQVHVHELELLPYIRLSQLYVHVMQLALVHIVYAMLLHIIGGFNIHNNGVGFCLA